MTGIVRWRSRGSEKRGSRVSEKRGSIGSVSECKRNSECRGSGGWNVW